MLKYLKICLSVILSLGLIFLSSCANLSETIETEETIDETSHIEIIDSDSSQNSKPSSSNNDGDENNMNENEKPSNSTPNNKIPSTNQGGLGSNVADQNIGSDIQISDTIKKEEQTVFTPITLAAAKANAEAYLNTLKSDASVSNVSALSSSIYNTNDYRLAKVIEKALKGENLTIATIGGSITNGAKATSTDKKFPNRILAWFEKTFPNIKVTLINAGIGATSSAFGIYRLKEDVLIYEPDIIFVEYAVNDHDNGAYLTSTYEGLLRSALAYEEVAVVPIYLALASKGSAQSEEKAIADHYKLPQADWLSAFKNYSDWSNMFDDDGVHPNNMGHARIGLIVSQLLTTALNNHTSAQTSYSIPSAKNAAASVYGKDYLVKLQYEGGKVSFLTNKVVNNKAVDSPLTDKITFTNKKYSLKQNDFGLVHHNFDIISVSSGKDNTLTFTIKDIRSFLIIMNRDVDGGTAIITVTENGTNKKTTYNANSYYSWSHLWDSGPIYKSSDGTPHTVTVSIRVTSGKFNIAGFGISD